MLTLDSPLILTFLTLLSQSLRNNLTSLCIFSTFQRPLLLSESSAFTQNQCPVYHVSDLAPPKLAIDSIQT